MSKLSELYNRAGSTVDSAKKKRDENSSLSALYNRAGSTINSAYQSSKSGSEQFNTLMKTVSDYTNRANAYADTDSDDFSGDIQRYRNIEGAIRNKLPYMRDYLEKNRYAIGNGYYDMKRYLDDVEAGTNFSKTLTEYGTKEKYDAAVWENRYSGMSYGDAQTRLNDDNVSDKEKTWLRQYMSTNDDFLDSMSSADIGKLQTETDDNYSSMLKRKNDINTMIAAFSRAGNMAGKVKELKEELAGLEKEMADVQSRSENLRWAKNRADRREKVDAWNQNRTNPDFAQGAISGSEIGNPSMDDLRNYDSNLQAAMSDPEKALALLQNPVQVQNKLSFFLANKGDKATFMSSTHGAWESVVEEGYNRNWDYLKPEEIELYNYLLSSQGSENADKYLQDMQVYLDKRALDEQSEKTNKAYSEANALEKTVLNIATIPASVFGGGLAFVDDTVNMLNGNEYNPYAPSHSATQFSNQVRELTGDEIRNAAGGGFWGDLAANTYQGVMSGADSVLRAYTLHGKLPILNSAGKDILSASDYVMFMGAAADKAQKLYESGASQGEMILGSIAAGSIETIFEHWSLENFTENFVESSPESLKMAILQALTQGATEGSEELFTDIANMAADAILYGANSDNSKMIQMLKLKGYTDGEARWATALSSAENAFWSFYGGFVSGAGMGASGVGKYAVNSIQQNHQLSQMGVNAYRAGNIENVINSANALQGNQKLKGLAEELSGMGQAETKEAKREIEKKAGKLYAGVTKAQAQEAKDVNRSTFQRMALENLKSKNVENAEKAAKIITKAMYDGALTHSEQTIFNEVGGKRVMEAVLNDRTNGKSTFRAEVAKAQQRNMFSREALIRDSFIRNNDAAAGDYGVNRKGYDYTTDADGNEQEINITGVKSVEGGNVILDIGNKGTVNASDVSFGDYGEAMMFSAIAGMNISADNANMLYRMAKSSDSMTDFALGIQEAYRYGKIGVGYEKIAENGFSMDIPEEVRKMVFNMGSISSMTEAGAKLYSLVSRSVKNNKAGKIIFEDIDMRGREINDQQRAGMQLANFLAASGLNVHIFESAIDENGNFKNRFGGDNGVYMTGEGDIYIDLLAGNKGEGTMAYTISHELTHFIEDWSPVKFKAFADALFQGMNMDGINVEAAVQKKLEQVKKDPVHGKKTEKKQYDIAYSEVVAEACERMLTDTDAAEKLAGRIKSEDKNLWKKICDFFKNLAQNLRKAYKDANLSPSSDIANAAISTIERVEKLRDLWVNAAVDSIQNFSLASDAQQKLQGIGISEKVAKDLAEAGLTAKNGVIISQELAAELGTGEIETPNYLVLAQPRTEPDWEKSYLDRFGDTRETRAVINAVKRMTDELVMNDLAMRFVPNGEYNYTNMGPLRKNTGGYIWTFDMDTSCPRTFQFNKYRDRLQQMAGRPLTYKESINLLELLRAYGQNIPCSYCYVENKRVLLNASYNNYFKFRSDVINAKTDAEAKKLMYGYNKKKGTMTDASAKVFEVWRNGSSKAPSVTDTWLYVNNARNSIFNYLDQEGNSGLPTSQLEAMVRDRFGITDKAAAAEIKNWVSSWKYESMAGIEHSYITQNDEEIHEIDQEMLAINHEAMAYAKSASSAKSVDNYVPYIDQLKNIAPEDKAYIIGMGGIRKHSSNDFRIDYVHDYMLFYADLAAEGYTGHTYTKNADFVKIFANTKDRINMSIAMYGGGGKGAVRENIDEGAIWKDVKELRKAYKNVGSMAMVTNDDQLSFALNADWIDMIIPFHASSLDKAVWYNLRAWQDYTSKQNETYLNAKAMKDRMKADGIPFNKSAKAAAIAAAYNEHYGIKMVYDEFGNRVKPHFMPEDTYTSGGDLIPGHHNNHERYLQLCNEYGVNPRFKGLKVRDANGNTIDITEHPGYVKLIKETARTDSEQEKIEFNFDKKDDFLGMTPWEYAMQQLEDYSKIGGYKNLGDDPYGIVNEFYNEYLGKDRDIGYLTDRAKSVMGEVSQAYREMNTVEVTGQEEIVQNGTVTDETGRSVDYLRSARVKDAETIDFLNNQEYVTTYKTMQLVDGKLYPPMAAVVAGSYEDYSELGAWEMATEHPELIKMEKGKPKFVLNKGKGKGSVPAAYNPYMHSSNLVLNDQFSSAYDRPNLVTVECRVPKSELTSGYHAQYAKDSVGWHSWHTGTVAGAVRAAKGIERQVLLSRWIMPVRIVPDSEVASMYKDILSGTDVSVPDNVVPPSLLAELKKAGVPIKETGKVRYNEQKNNTAGGDVLHSIRDDIIGDSGKHYGRGVYLDTDLYEKNSSQKRWVTLKAHLRGIGNSGQKFPATDSNGNVHYIGVVPNKKFMNSDGDMVAANMHLLGFLKNDTKQEILALVDQAISTARFERSEDSKKSHGWVDNGGKNKWEYWSVIVQDKNNSIYQATLQIANTEDGEKLVYEAYPIEELEHGLKRSTSPVIDNVPQTDESVNMKSSRENGGMSNREILANALETTVQNDIERDRLAEYKANIQKAEDLQSHLSELKAEMKELSFGKGKRDKARISALRDEITKTSNRLNIIDGKLLKLESTKALKGLLDRERDKAMKKVKSEFKDYKANRQRTVEREKIQKVVNELNNYLLHGSKDKHVPKELEEAVAVALDAVNMDTAGSKVENRIKELQAQLARTKNQERAAQISRQIYRLMHRQESIKDSLERLHQAYEKFIDSEDPLISGAYDSVISEKIMDVVEKVGNTPLADMSKEQLEAVYDMYKAVLHKIRTANKAFAQEKADAISSIAVAVMGQLNTKRANQMTTKFGKTVSQFSWNNEKPVYAFERIGSSTLTGLYESVRKGEDKWALDIVAARQFYLDNFNKYGVKEFDFEKQYKFTSSSGLDFNLNLSQIMSLYAFSKREQAADHIRKGGIVLDENTKVTVKGVLGVKRTLNVDDATTYNISDDTLYEIIGKLDEVPGAKQFVDAMQAYLSDVMGAKGNEVSMALYGIDLFKEKNYFPLKSAEQYMAVAKEQQQGTTKIKNKGFTKDTVKKASNPIVLSGFMDVWANHVNEMSMYHAFTLPMEDFYRVYNWKTRATEDTAQKSIQAALENSAGKSAVVYIDQLLKDLNGGLRADPRETVSKALMSRFKKAAVFASASVVIQQPSAIGRAYAIIDPKYFVGERITEKSHKDKWDECKKYAPVAIIKEMGYFDTNMGMSTTDYLTAEEYSTLGDKAKGFFTDSNYRDEVIGFAPSFADEITWTAIWEACKRETKAKYGLSGEPLLKMAGSRFTEVITKTQVYDSVFSRSSNMRAKSGLMGMVTSFMAEPTTSINMLENSLRQWKRGNRKLAVKSVAAVLASVIFNNILVSFVYAARDKDEDKNFLEKYLTSFAGGMLDDLNPLTYIPYLKDVWSLLQGYDIERADMSLITGMVDAVNSFAQTAMKDTSNMDEDEIKTLHRKMIDEGWKLVDGFCSMLGIPEKNIRRDINAVINVMQKSNWVPSSQKTIFDAIKDEIISDVPIMRLAPKDSKGDRMYDAILSGDDVAIGRLRSRYASQKAFDTAIKKALRDNDPRIRAAALAQIAGNNAERVRIAKEIIAEGYFSQDLVIAAINNEITELDTGESKDYVLKAQSMYTVDDYIKQVSEGKNGDSMKTEIIRANIANGGKKEKAEETFTTSVRNELHELYKDGAISSAKAKKALIATGMSDSDAESRIGKWDFGQKYPELDWSEESISRYYDELEPLGISVSVYNEYKHRYKLCTGTDENGDGKTDSGSKKEQVLRMIDQLPLTVEQKDALYLQNGWSENTLRNAPWH